MADNVKEKRLALNDAKAARRSLARALRMRFRGEIDSATFRDMVYGLHCLLGFDKLQKETELERRMSELESRRGQITLSITPEEASGLDDSDWRETPVLEASSIPDPVPAIQELPEQPQPRRLKL
jgi:hypothetical protein